MIRVPLPLPSNMYYNTGGTVFRSQLVQANGKPLRLQVAWKTNPCTGITWTLYGSNLEPVVTKSDANGIPTHYGDKIGGVVLYTKTLTGTDTGGAYNGYANEFATVSSGSYETMGFRYLWIEVTVPSQGFGAGEIMFGFNLSNNPF